MDSAFISKQDTHKLFNQEGLLISWLESCNERIMGDFQCPERCSLSVQPGAEAHGTKPMIGKDYNVGGNPKEKNINGYRQIKWCGMQMHNGANYKANDFVKQTPLLELLMHSQGKRQIITTHCKGKEINMVVCNGFNFFSTIQETLEIHSEVLA